MLIQNTSPSVTVGDIVTIRVTATKEEIVGKVTAVDAGHITLSRPLLVMIQMSGQSLGIGLLPFMPSADEQAGFRFALGDLLVAPVPVRSDMKSEYLQMTTGIAIPTKSLIQP